MRISLCCCVLAAMVLAIHDSALVASAADPEFAPEALEFFEKKIRPVLVSRCYECHSTNSSKLRGGLLLDSREGVLNGGESGAVLVAGEPDKSPLIKAIKHDDPEQRMPPSPYDKLSVEQIADLVAWVKMGAPDPRKAPPKGTLNPPPKYGMTLEEGRAFWSFKPVTNPTIPVIKNTAWVRNSIDAFILAKLEAAGITPTIDADKRTLLRRVTFDLTGLPPTPSEIEAFLNDTSDDAWPKVIDRLLESPRYGERWGRHWLDVVRYADTCGNASDYPVPQAYRYRDWVIRAVQRDLPYDQFVREQFAGDLMPSSSEQERQERIIATGYLAISRRFGGGRAGEHHLTIEDTIDNLGKAVLGTTLSCARCHDHKFDPFTTSDYYGLYGIFSSTRYPHPGAEGANRQEDLIPLASATEIETLKAAQQSRIAALMAEVKQLEAKLAEANQAPESADKKPGIDAANKALAEGKKRLAAEQATPLPIETAYAVTDGKIAAAKVQLRGDPKKLGDEVQRHFPAILGGQTLGAEDKTSGRLQLAQWLTDRANPLTARVMANRLWQYHFGKGLVQTPNDFGKQGKAPTHPELLDHLATRFMESGWSLKAMHRLILLSHAWQLATTEQPQGQERDPHNDLCWRFERHRLDAESIRDTLLFVSGELDESTTGGHPFPAQTSWGFTQHNPFFANYETRRRSVYLMQQRLKKNPYLALFDGADPSSSTPLRQPSTSPLQALFVMNGTLAHGTASKFAERITASGTDEAVRISTAYQLAFNRLPSTDELRESNEFLATYRQRLGSTGIPKDQQESRVWTALARVILSTNELIFVD